MKPVRIKKTKKEKSISQFFFPLLVTISFLVLLLFIFIQPSSVPEHQIYTSLTEVNQGETILLKVSGVYSLVKGTFDNHNIVFFKNNPKSDWIAFLGIDADTKPGKNKIQVTANSEKIEKEISVRKGSFPSSGIIMNKDLQDKGFTNENIVENIVKSDNPALNQALSKSSKQPYFKESFSNPLKGVKKTGLVFGQIINGPGYFLRYFGIDLRASMGTEVYSVNEGRVVLAKELLNYGKTIVVDHGMGIFSLYLHLDSYSVSKDQYVKRGQAIGLSGNTGYSSAPHLHFSMKDNGARVDPLLFIETTKETDSNMNLANISKNVSRSIMRFLGIQ